MSKSGFKFFLAATAVSLLGACSGGTIGEPGDTGETPDGGDTSAAVATLKLLSSTTKLRSDADTQAEGITLTALATDSLSNTVSGAVVTFSIAAGDGALIVTQGTTDAAGRALAVLTTGGNSDLRDITVKAASGAEEASLDIEVVSSTTPPTTDEDVADLNLFASSLRLFNDADTPEEGVTLTAVVTNAAGNVIAGVPVSFAVVAGPAGLQVIQGTTDGSGTATAILTTLGITTARVVTISASVTAGSTTFSRNIQIAVVGRAAMALGFLSSQRLPQDNSVPVQVFATAQDDNGNPKADVPVTFFVTSGALSSGGSSASNTITVNTNGAGVTPVITLTTGGDPTLRTIQITIAPPGGTGTADSADILVVPAVDEVRLISSSSELLTTAANPDDGVTLTAIVKDVTGNVINGEPVGFEIVTGSGALQVLEGVTNTAGMASTILTTGGNSTPRTITVRARAQNETADRAISVVTQLTPAAPEDIADIELLASATSMSGDADTVGEGVTLTAVVTDPSGNVVPSVPVTFSVPSGDGAIQVTRGTTDATGTATAILTTGGNSMSRTITVTGSATGSSGQRTDTIDIQVTNVPAANTVTLSSSASRIFADAPAGEGGSVQITALVQNSNGQVVSGVPVTFAVDNGGAIQVTRATTDSTGTALATLTKGVAVAGSTLTVTATVDLPSGADPQDDIAITVVNRVNSITLLSSSPQLSSAAVSVANGVTLTAIVKDSDQNVVPGVTVNFGLVTTNCGTSPAGSTAGTLTAIDSVTNGSGAAQAVLTTGGNARNRAVNVRAASSTAAECVTVDVSGTTLTVSGPTSTQATVATEFVATLADSAGKGIPNQTVTLSVPTGVGSVSPTSATTNASGQVTVDLTAASGTSITLRAVSLGITTDTVLDVSSDSFAWAPCTSAGTIGTPLDPDDDNSTAPFLPTEVPLSATDTTFSVEWSRAGTDGADLNGKPVTFSISRGSITTTGTPGVSTDPEGMTSGGGMPTPPACAQVLADSNTAGPATLIATGVDTTTDPDTVVTAIYKFNFIATVPDQLALQADPGVIGTNQQSTVVAVVRDLSNNLVKGATVNFVLTDATGGSLSAGQAVTNSQGQASVVYTSSSTPSALNGVSISATAVGGSAPSDTITLTVGSRSARIALGTGNELFESDDTTRYELPYTALVTDNAGTPAPDADLRLTLRPKSYRKGYWVRGTETWVQVVTAECPNEDLNHDGILQVGPPTEDTDGDGILDPSNVGTVPLSPVLDENGIAEFNVVYPQDRAKWVTVELDARALLSGTETVERAIFVLPIITDDIQLSVTPPGNPSPYGIGCGCDRDDSLIPKYNFQQVRVATLEGDTAGQSATFIVKTDRPVEGSDLIIPITVSTVTSSIGMIVAPSTITIPDDDMDPDMDGVEDNYVTFSIMWDGNTADNVDSSILIQLELPDACDGIYGDKRIAELFIADDDV